MARNTNTIVKGTVVQYKGVADERGEFSTGKTTSGLVQDEQGKSGYYIKGANGEKCFVYARYVKAAAPTPTKLKVSVPNVLLPNGTVRRVRFSARPKAVTARTTGLPKIKIMVAGKKFLAEVADINTKRTGRSQGFVGKTPAQAFANAAKYAWA